MKSKHGGARKGAGRKPKADEMKLAERMRNVLTDDFVLNKLADQVKEGDMRAIELWTGYLYGKPTQRVETKEVSQIPQTIFVDATNTN